jgi:hypothetical protein
MYILPAFTSINTPKTPLTVIINRKDFFFKQGLSIYAKLRAVLRGGVRLNLLFGFAIGCGHNPIKLFEYLPR